MLVSLPLFLNCISHLFLRLHAFPTIYVCVVLATQCHTLVKVSAPWTFALNLLNQKRCGWAGWDGVTHSTGNFKLFFSSLFFSSFLTQSDRSRNCSGRRSENWSGRATKWLMLSSRWACHWMMTDRRLFLLVLFSPFWCVCVRVCVHVCVLYFNFVLIFAGQVHISAP